MLNVVSKGTLGELVGWCLGINRQNVDFVAGLGHELEHFLEPIGISRDMRKGCRLYHQTDFARGMALEGRSVIAIVVVLGPQLFHVELCGG